MDKQDLSPSKDEWRQVHCFSKENQGMILPEESQGYSGNVYNYILQYSSSQPQMVN